MTPLAPVTPALGSTGPASAPTANAGLEADAMSKVREAVHLLEMALPKLPTGGEGHKAVIDSLSKLSKSFPATEEVPGVQNTQLLQLAQRAKQQAMLQAVVRAQQQSQAGGGAPGGAAGDMPTPGAASPAPMAA